MKKLYILLFAGFCIHLSAQEFTIQGNNSYDYNLNGCDSNDEIFPRLKMLVLAEAANELRITDGSGYYQIPVYQGITTIIPTLENPSYFSIFPESITVNFPEDVNPAVKNFCLTPIGNHPDLEIVILPMQPAVPGFNARYKIVYKNKGNQILAGTVSMNYNGSSQVFVSGNPEVTDQSSGSLSWDFDYIAPLQTKEIDVILYTNSPTDNPPVNVNDQLAFTVQVESAGGDEEMSDNAFSSPQTVVGSYASNSITCLQGETVSTSIAGNYVHYLIRFANSGGFDIQNMVIRCVLDQDKFDVHSLVPIRGSHSFSTRILQQSQVFFVFDNINLPFNPEDNSGYISFKVRLNENLSEGDQFSATAEMFYDSTTPAVVTNTALTTIVGLGVADAFSEHVKMYPNPASDAITLESKGAQTIEQVEIYTIAGQKIYSSKPAAVQTVLPLQHLPGGLYLIKVQVPGGNFVSRFIKN